MSKKIDRALHDLVKALGKHAESAADPKAGKNKTQKAAAKVRTAATAYGALISARNGAPSPFADIPDPRLDEPTVASLKAERDALAKRRASREKKDGAHVADGAPLAG